MLNLKNNAWKYPPRKRPHLERHGLSWIALTAAFVVFAMLAGKGVKQIAYDSVNFENMKGFYNVED